MAAAIKELQETAIVMAGIQSRQAGMLTDHAEWLQSHDRAMVRHDKEMAEARERGRATDERIDRLVSAIGELIRARS
jgi:F0F1-type ATP synthase epsilon subunit